MNAHAGDRERAKHLSIVRLRRSCDADLVRIAVTIAKTPCVALARIFVAEARVRSQIGRHFGGRMLRQIGRCSAADELRDADLASDQAATADIPDADSQIDAFIDDVDSAIGELDIEAQLRMSTREVRDRRREMPHAEGDRRGELERAARYHGRRRHRLLGFLQIREQLNAALVKGLAGLRQRKPARRSVHETRIEMRFEVRDMTRYRGRRHCKALGGAREASLLDDLGKYHQRKKAVHFMSFLAIIYVILTSLSQNIEVR